MNNELEFDIKELDLLMLKVSKVHEKKHPELIEINDIYSKLKEKIVQLSKITVWETQSSCCSYFEAE